MGENKEALFDEKPLKYCWHERKTLVLVKHETGSAVGDISAVPHLDETALSPVILTPRGFG